MKTLAAGLMALAVAVLVISSVPKWRTACVLGALTTFGTLAAAEAPLVFPDRPQSTFVPTRSLRCANGQCALSLMYVKTLFTVLYVAVPAKTGEVRGTLTEILEPKLRPGEYAVVFP